MSTRRELDLEALVLGVGAHAEGTGEMCVMEAAACVAGEDWTDRPASISPVIRDLLLGLNDSMSDVDRQALRPLIPALVGSRADEDVEAARSWLAMDWHCRAWPSAWLLAAGCVDEAAELAGAAIFDPETLSAALPRLRRTRVAAAARRMAVVEGFLDEGLARAIAGAGADRRDPAMVAARAAIRTGGGWAPVRAMQKAVPDAAGWSADRGAAWAEAWDAAGHRVAVVTGAAQIAAVRAAFASSAWEARWMILGAGALESWALACDDARSTGRDAALAVALQASWAATGQADQGVLWPEAAEAAAAALQAPVSLLQLAALRLVAALVALDLEALSPAGPRVHD